MDHLQGENVWQTPAQLCIEDTKDPLSLGNFSVVEGAAPSYNNWADVDRMLQTITHSAAGFDKNFGYVPKIAVGVKHGNACGAAVGTDTTQVLKNVVDGDPLAIFGGFVMTNFPIARVEAECLRRYKMQDSAKRLFDGVSAPFFSDEAKKELARRGGKCRLFQNKALDTLSSKSIDYSVLRRHVRGGYLEQPNYTFVLDINDPDLEYNRKPEDEKLKDVILAWAVGSTSNSNTITLVKDGRIIGNGVGQQDRVGAARLAIDRALRSGHKIEGATAYSDSFFPFVDGPTILIDAGVKVIFATGGSIRDQEIKEYCMKRGAALLLIPDAKGRGFFGH